VIVGRIIGWVLCAIALMLIGMETLASFRAGSWDPQLLGQLWFEFDSGSLNLVQAVVQRYLIPELWDPVILAMLLWPAWIVFLIPGLILVILCRKRDNRFAPRKYLN
jgi:ABC-type Fe3+-siderophore transport system permease subunit